MNINRLGFWSAILSLIFAMGYAVAQLLSWLNILQHPHELFWLFLPSLFLAPAFMVLIACLHYAANGHEKIWTAIAISFGVIYCAFATMNYFTQLTVIVPALIRREINETYPLAFKHGSFMFAIDCLGYFFMSLSSLFAAFAFRKKYKNLYTWMLINGLLILIFIAAYFNPFFYFIGSVWIVTFSLSMIYAARLFHNNSQTVKT
ncbi:hypothetical protein [Mucilaginibacter gotjawali]|uniref:MFS family permease n=2 Tax=Mucilaginibacter gotjawali TaxID=1550579 RepID=A0A839SB41_9SPHI|nr:hypothetical protein [Mucilaginibacter gotjawali]MBB3055315.1 MFS family permease [Mucilaginibacter gotjawali]BAU53408.1 hypothetical protein MgSA37_01576 [Mucilaginibacter gotjawali]